MDTPAVYDSSKSPMQNLLENTPSKAEKIAIYEFAKRHGITEDESLWNQMLLQLGLLNQHIQTSKMLEESNKKIAADIDQAIDSAIKRMLETAHSAADDAVHQIGMESEKQVDTLKAMTDKLTRETLIQLREASKSAVKESLQDGAEGIFKELNYFRDGLKNEILLLQNAGKIARQEAKTTLLETAIYTVAGSLIGLVMFCLLGKFVLRWF